MNTYMIRRHPEPGCRWHVRDAVLGWFSYQVARRFADEQRQTGRQVEIGYSSRDLQDRLPRARRPQRQPHSEPEAGI